MALIDCMDEEADREQWFALRDGVTAGIAALEHELTAMTAQRNTLYAAIPGGAEIQEALAAKLNDAVPNAPDQAREASAGAKGSAATED